jgi:hypothetical protein
LRDPSAKRICSADDGNVHSQKPILSRMTYRGRFLTSS